MRAKALIILLFVTACAQAALPGAPVLFVDGERASASPIVRVYHADLFFTTEFDNGAVFYTLDGSEPSADSTRYSEPFVLKGTGARIVRAIAFSADGSQQAASDPIRVEIAPATRLILYNFGGGRLLFDQTPRMIGDEPHFALGSTLRVTAVPDPGNSFIGWIYAAGTENPISIQLTESFQYFGVLFGGPLTIAQPNNGSIFPHHAPDLLAFGNPVLLTALPSSGHYFSTWSGAASGSTNPLSFTHPLPAADGTPANVSATFLPLPEGNATLAVFPQQPEGGRVSIEHRKSDFSYAAAAQNYYPLGERLYISATPEAGFAFAGWSGDETGSENPLLVRLDRSKTIAANFVPGARLQIFTSGGRVEVTPLKEIYEIGETVTLSAIADRGFSFHRFVGNGIASTETPCSFTVTRNNTIYGRFNASEREPAWVRRIFRSLICYAADYDGNVFIGYTSLVPDDIVSGFSKLSADGAYLGDNIAEGFPLDIALTPGGGIFLATQTGENTGRLLNYGSGIPGGELNFRPLNLAAADGTQAYVRGTDRIDSFWQFGRYAIPAPMVGRLAVGPTIYYSAGQSATREIFGRQWFQTRIDEGIHSLAGPTLSGDTLYALGGSGRLWALDFAGRTRWSFAPPDTLVPPTIGADGTLYVVSQDTPRVFALNPNGSIKWTRTPGRPPYQQPAIGSDGTIYLVDADGLHALNPDGERLWQFRTNALRAPILAGPNVYVANNAKLFAFRANAPGYANSPWPMAEAGPMQNSAVRRVFPIPQLAIDHVSASTIRLDVATERNAKIDFYISEDLLTWRLLHSETAESARLSLTRGVTAAPSFYRVFRTDR